MAKTPIFPRLTDKTSRLAQGYTLAELLVVLMILGLVTGIAAPRLVSRSEPALLKKDAALVSQLLRSAKIKARRTGISTRVLIDPDEKQVWMEGQERILRLDPALSLRAIGADAESSKDIIGIRFFADGMSTGGEVELGIGTKVQKIEVIWANAEVRLAQE
jgi:general secretion pathway protein H